MGRRKSGKNIQTIPLQYDVSETLEQMGKELITNYHSDLVNQNISYLFKNKPIMNKGKECIACVKKCGPLTKALSGKDFVVIVCYETWNRLEDKQKLAALDHELTHCLIDEDDKGNEKKKLIPHDFEEFGIIIQRHGLVFEDLQKLGRIIEDTKESK